MSDSDGAIQIGTQVDVSTLSSGLDEAADIVQSSAASMSEAMQAARVATQNLAEAQAQFGAAAAAGSKQAADVIAQYSAELAQARAAVTALATAESEETAVVTESISARAAATAELRLLSGSISGADRAAGMFLGTLPGIAPLMQAAFAPIAVVGIVLILDQAVEGIAHFVEGARELATETGTGWLDAAIGQVDGLADAVKQAEAEILNLSTDMDTLLAQRQQESLHEIARTQGPAAAMRAEAEALTEKLTKNQALLQVLQAQRDVEAQSATTPQYTDFGGIALFLNQQQEALKAQQDLAQTKRQIADLDQSDLNIVQKISDLQAEAADQKDWVSPLAREQQEAAKRWQDQLQEMSKETDSLIDKASKSEEEALAKVSALAGPNASPIFQSISRQISATDNADAQKQLVQMAEAIAKGNEATRSLVPNSAGEAGAIDDYIEHYQKLTEAQVQATDIAQKNADALTEAGIRAQEATHMITPLAVAEQTAALHAKEYSEALAALNEQLEVYRQVGKDAQAAQTQNQIAQLQGTHAAQALQDQAQIQQQIAVPWMNAFQQINQSWLEVQNRMFYSTRNIGLEFAKMGQQIFLSIVDSLEKAVIVAAEKEMMMRLLHQQTVNQNTQTTQQGAVQQNAISAWSSLKEVTHAAAAAAAKSFQAMAGIPVVGPVLGAIAAAGTFAAVEAFGAMASFDTGTGFVPYDGVAMIHAGEMVLPAPTADELRNGSGDAGDINIHHITNINAATDRQIIAAIRRNPREIATAMQRHLRQNGKG